MDSYDDFDIFLSDIKDILPDPFQYSSFTPADQPEFQFGSLFEQVSRPAENPTSELNLAPLHVDSVADGPTADAAWLSLNVTSSSETKSSDAKINVASDFECNICYEVAKEPVVTCCGHLFCWPCLYRWLHVHCENYKECPVCKGKVNESSTLPIYGRGSCDGETEKKRKIGGFEVPYRPRGNRVESVRQQQEITSPRRVLIRRDEQPVRVYEPVYSQTSNSSTAQMTRGSNAAAVTIVVDDSQSSSDGSQSSSSSEDSHSSSSSSSDGSQSS